MSDIKLFKLQGQIAQELPGKASDLEKPLQTLIEKNLEELLGVRFLVSGALHGQDPWWPNRHARHRRGQSRSRKSEHGV